MRGTIAGVLVLVPVLASAQDTNYWTEQYGNRARLLAGAVIGSADDLSAVYYNPGAFALVKKPELLLAGNVVQYESLDVQNSLGTGNDLKSSHFGGAPSLFAGELRLGFLGRSRLAYSFLTRQEFNLTAEQRGQVEGSSLFPGVPFYEANVSFDQRLTDYWGGLTWAHPVGERFGVGATTFFAVRTQRTRFSSLAQGLGANGKAAVAVNGREFKYTDWRLLAKLGFDARFRRGTLGISLTTPSAHLFGSGDTAYNKTGVGQGIDAAGQPLTFVATNFQQDLPSSFTSPFSVGVGGSYVLGSTTLNASVEWFQAVGEKTLLDSVPFTPQTGGSPIPTAVTYRLDSVFNVALGVEHKFRYGWRAFASFRTDYTGATPGEQGDSTVSFWNIYHVSTGATLTVGRAAVTLGVVGASGSATTARGLPLVPGQDEIGLPPGLDVSYFRLTFILGFNFSFN